MLRRTFLGILAAIPFVGRKATAVDTGRTVQLAQPTGETACEFGMAVSGGGGWTKCDSTGLIFSDYTMLSWQDADGKWHMKMINSAAQS